MELENKDLKERKFWTRAGEYFQATRCGETVTLAMSARLQHTWTNETGETVSALAFTREEARGIYLSLSNVVGDAVAFRVDRDFMRRGDSFPPSPERPNPYQSIAFREFPTPNAPRRAVPPDAEPKIIPIKAGCPAKIIPSAPAPRSGDV